MSGERGTASTMWELWAGLLVAAVLLEAAGLFLWYACSWPHSQVICPALVRGPSGPSQVALTFDDGPHPPFTDRILDILRDRRVPATFFVCGYNAERRPDLIHRIYTEGHAVGNHTYSHPYLYFRSPSDMAKEIDRTQEVIHRITGEHPVIFRPPYGGRWFGLEGVLRERGLSLIQWSDGGEDWQNHPMAQEILRGLRAGSIICLHDGEQAPGGYLTRLLDLRHSAAKGASSCRKEREQAADRSSTVRALPAIIDGARKNGFEFVPLIDFLAKR